MGIFTSQTALFLPKMQHSEENETENQILSLLGSGQAENVRLAEALCLSQLGKSIKRVIEKYGFHTLGLEKPKQFINLEYLEVCSAEPSTEALGFLTSLQHLQFSTKNLSSYDFLENLTQLHTLSARDVGIKDLAFIQKIPQIKRLEIENFEIFGEHAWWRTENLPKEAPDALKHLDDLAGLQQLVELSIQQNELVSVQGLAGLQQLEWVNLHGNQIEDISPFCRLKNLHTLRLEYNRISNIPDFSQLVNLTNLALSYNPLKDISSLAAIGNLLELELNDCGLTDISDLAYMPTLEELGLAGNQLESLPDLSTLQRLKGLNLSGNLLKNIQPLADLTSLESLFLNNNPIEDFSPLFKLPNLSRVDLGCIPDTPESKKMVQKIQRAMPHCSVEYMFLEP